MLTSVAMGFVSAICAGRSWPAAFQRMSSRFAADSPLEEGVTCELVSESPKFPASREKTGNFHRSALRGCQMMPNTGADPMAYEEIPYTSEQGIFGDLTGNSNRGIREFPASSGNPDFGSSPWHLPLTWRSGRSCDTKGSNPPGRADDAAGCTLRMVRIRSAEPGKCHGGCARAICEPDLSEGESAARRAVSSAPEITKSTPPLAKVFAVILNAIFLDPGWL